MFLKSKPALCQQAGVHISLWQIHAHNPPPCHRAVPALNRRDGVHLTYVFDYLFFESLRAGLSSVLTFLPLHKPKCSFKSHLINKNRHTPCLVVPLGGKPTVFRSPDFNANHYTKNPVNICFTWHYLNGQFGDDIKFLFQNAFNHPLSSDRMFIYLSWL